jgi:hypothetical protein
MSPIITQPVAPAHVHPDEAARGRRDRLARATAEQAEAALTYLSMIDPLMFGMAMDAADLTVGLAPGAGGPEDEEPVPVCRQCGALAGDLPRPRPGVAALPRRRHHGRRPGDLRPRPLRRGHLAPPRRGPARALAGGSLSVPRRPAPGPAGTGTRLGSGGSAGPPLLVKVPASHNARRRAFCAFSRSFPLFPVTGVRRPVRRNEAK